VKIRQDYYERRELWHGGPSETKEESLREQEGHYAGPGEEGEKVSKPHESDAEWTGLERGGGWAGSIPERGS
jgi:hypothetical protein